MQGHFDLVTSPPTPHAPRPDFDPFFDLIIILTRSPPSFDLLGRFGIKVGRGGWGVRVGVARRSASVAASESCEPRR